MATTEELFISISPEIYKKNKSAILISQSHLLKTLKHLQNMKVLSKQKNDLIIQLYKLFLSLSTQIISIQEKIPTPKIPKKIKQKETYLSKKEKTLSKRDEIEEELKLIQAKLQELNS